MQLEIRVKKDGRWQGLSIDEAGHSLDDRILNLSKCETVIHYTNGDQECFISSDKWADYYKTQGKVSIKLSDLVLLLDLHPTIHHALKVFGGHIERQETLGI